jgi:hypothetical protein
VFSLATFMAPACVSKFGVKRALRHIRAVYYRNSIQAASSSALLAMSRAPILPLILPMSWFELLQSQIHRQPHLHHTAAGAALLVFYRRRRSHPLDCTSAVRSIKFVSRVYGFVMLSSVTIVADT